MMSSHAIIPADPVTGDAPAAETAALIEELTAIRAAMLAASCRLPKTVHDDFRASAVNLLHYLALRQCDLRPLQGRLAELGLSSLGRSESHVLASVEAVLVTLHQLAGSAAEPDFSTPAGPGFKQGPGLLQQHAVDLLGKPMAGRNTHIMVTMPSQAATDYKLVHDLLASGMDCMRINCAHDGPDIWSGMIANLRRAEQALGRLCKVSMDLAGPKLRTGPVGDGPAVLKLRPRRDSYGNVIEPTRVWLTPDRAPRQAPSPADACLSVPADWLDRLDLTDTVRLRDARGARRRFQVVDKLAGGCWLEGNKTVYLTNGTRLQQRNKTGKLGRTALIGCIPGRESSIHLSPGDLLVLTPDLAPGRQATRDSAGHVLSPAMIGCTLPDVLQYVKPGEEVWFDDGRIGGEVESNREGHLSVRIRHALPSGSKLRGDKGINFPASDLPLPGLTPKDVQDLAFVSRHADMVALSFANTVEDVCSLNRSLRELGADRPFVVLKIETVKGFRNLPAMLLEAMTNPGCGVMIARGDLAVEAGFERLAEVQEEILWLCEAAHVPVIWATQVLENLAKTGAPTRAEITDAAMGHRAECVMLNKGPYIIETVKSLDNILRRMQGHQFKKQSMLRELSLAGAYSPVV